MPTDVIVDDGDGLHTVKDEGDLGSSAEAGMVLEETAADTYAPNTTDADVNPAVALLIRAFDPDLEVGDTIPSGERVQIGYPQSGARVAVIVDESEDIAFGDELVLSGDGRVREFAADGAGTKVFLAREAAVTGVGEQALIEARVI